MGVLHKLMPSRDEKRRVNLIADLDDLISQPIGFKYLGKEYIIEPMTTHNFMIVSRALQDLENVLKDKNNEDFNEDDIYQAYYDFISTLCPRISISDIRKAKIAQLHALLNLMIRHITGQTAPDMVAVDDTEKKKILNQINSRSSIFSRSLHSFLGSIRLASNK
jgi:hypothetical protein